MDECTLWQRIRHQIRESCANLDQCWMKRRRVFNTELILKGLFQLSINRCHQSYQRAMSEVVGLADLCPAAASFCDARAKVDYSLIKEARRDVMDVWDELHVNRLSWFGYEPYAIDGSKINLPLQLRDSGYKQSGNGHYPLGLVSILLRLSDRMVCDVRLAKIMDERELAHEHLAYLSKKDVVVYDRGYISFSLLAAHIAQGIPAVFRVNREASYLEFKEFHDSSKFEDIVTIEPSETAYRNASKRYSEYDFKPVTLRLIKYEILGKRYLLATTILDSSITRSDFTELYSKRWLSEEAYKIFKPVLDLEVFHSTKENGVKQELEATILLWNLSRMIGSFCESTIKKSNNLLNFIALSAQLPPSAL